MAQSLVLDVQVERCAGAEVTPTRDPSIIC
jgi:hypothetical protein